MTKTEYAEYLGSEHWQQFRKEILAERDACEECALPRWVAQLLHDQDLHVHHKNYSCRGRETGDDVRVLCARCHEIETFGRSDLRELKTHECKFCGTWVWDRYAIYCQACRRMLEFGDEYPLFLNWEAINPRSGQPLWVDMVENLADLALYCSPSVEQITGKLQSEISRKLLAVTGAGSEVP